jgi:pimeloyl-ACP methyl ester carboxylesterase
MFRFTITLLATLLATSAANAQEPGPQLELKDCRINAGPGTSSMKARCGTLLRPLDPSGAVPGEIELRIAVVPALNLTPEPDPLVPIAGGPGQSSVQFYAGYSWAFEDVRRNRDILLIVQRGTGESATMDCEFDDSVADGEYSIEQTIEYTERCLAELPYDPRFFTTSVAVTDIEAVREALGYPSLNLYGISYGTRVAQHFARRYPDSTRTVVIDGVVPPQLSLGPEIATESQKAIDKILARCVAEESCHERFPDLRESFARVVADLRAVGVEITVPHPSTGRPEKVLFGIGEFSAAVRLLAYHPHSMALIPLLIDEAGKGNLVPLGSQYMMTMIAMMDALSLGMHNAVMCAEDVPFYDPSTIDYDGLEASYMGTLQLEALDAICSVWPAGPIDENFKAPLATNLPVLLLSGDADPITPPRYADMAMIDLENATHLIGKDQGHGQVSVGCNPRLVADFIDSADPAGLDASCLERSFVMPFFLDFSGPKP